MIRTTLRRRGLDLVPRRAAATTWRAFLRQQAAGIVACDLLCRRHGLAAAAVGAVVHRTGHPPGAPGRRHRQPGRPWVTQQARNLLLVLGEQGRRARLVLHDRDATFSGSFDHGFRSDGGEVVLTPVQALRANAYAERWVPTVRAECLDRLLIVGRGHLERILRVYV
ncbi:MAG TPA: integrase, partial [Actinomycetes bacterium]|nr:integrase [Actinomycetes bacterium]